MVAFWEDWVRQFPIWGIEDGLAEDDWKGWQLLTERLGKKIQLVGDDIFVTNPAIIRRAVAEKVGNAALIKLNQIGTLTETLEAIEISRAAHYGIVVSHRSGETPEDFIADLTVPTRAGQTQDRRALPRRARGQVQPAPAHRGGIGREGEVRRGRGVRPVARDVSQGTQW